MKKIMFIIWVLVALTACQFAPRAYTVLLDSPGHLSENAKLEAIDENLISANHQLAQTMLSYFENNQTNTFVSPLSLQLALAMTINGADHTTLAQMQKALYIDGMTLNDFNKAFKNLQHQLLRDQGIQFKLSNSIWIRNTYQDQVLPTFLETNKTFYNPMIAAGDFSNKEMVKAINDWVYKNTNKTIQEAVEYPIDSLTQMFLINTLYFKGDWQLPFKKENTSLRSFLDQQVDTMAMVNYLHYYENDNGQFVSLPYGDSSIVMLLGLAKDNQYLEVNQFMDALELMNLAEVDLQMPKLKLEFSYKLENFLKAQGMTHAFDGKIADFSKMADNAIEAGLHIASITQKTFLAVDEKGTEAAAMTKVEMGLESAPMEPSIKMHLNRPYTFMIYDTDTQIIYFVGNIQNPLTP